MPPCLPKGRKATTLANFMKKSLLKLTLWVLDIYKDIRYFFGPKITVGRTQQYKTFAEALSQIKKKYTSIILMLAGGVKHKVRP